MARDFMLDNDGRLVLRAGGIHTGESTSQEVALILATNKGEWRHDPLCGCDLVKRTNGRITRSELERIARLQLERDGKDWPSIKAGITLRTNGE